MKKEDPADMGALLRRLVGEIQGREGITQADVARRSGLDPASLNHSFHHINSAAAVRRVCQAFGYHVEVVKDAK